MWRLQSKQKAGQPVTNAHGLFCHLFFPACQTFEVRTHTRTQTHTNTQRAVCTHILHRLLQQGSRESRRGMTIDWKESQYRTEEKRTLKVYTHCVCVYVFLCVCVGVCIYMCVCVHVLLLSLCVPLKITHRCRLLSDVSDTSSNECVSASKSRTTDLPGRLSLFLVHVMLSSPVAGNVLPCWGGASRGAGRGKRRRQMRGFTLRQRDHHLLHLHRARTSAWLRVPRSCHI